MTDPDADSSSITETSTPDRKESETDPSLLRTNPPACSLAESNRLELLGKLWGRGAGSARRDRRNGRRGLRRTSSSSRFETLYFSCASSYFFSHASRSDSTRATCLSKCSALTSTCRSLIEDSRGWR